MRGLMMDRPLSIASLLQFASTNHGKTEIVSRTVEGPLHVYTYGDCYRRVRRLANALSHLGIAVGDRVGTLAWNGFRHFELYYAISGSGAVCHTINPRLTPIQIEYIINHARDTFLFVDLTFVPLLEALANRLDGVKGFVVMTDRASMPPTALSPVHCYEELISGSDDTYVWPRIDENAASSLCYSSGTTGEPKGTLYSHRSTVLHAFAACFPDNFAFSSRETVLPLVPLFHVNAWGVPYACPMVGAKIVFPGPKLDAPTVFELLESQQVTYALGVPTLWFQLLEFLRSTGNRPTSLKRITSGGSAVPISMIRSFEDEYGIEIRQGWGMTELSPIGLQGTLTGTQLKLSREEQLRVRAKQGRPVFGIEIRIVDKNGDELPRDGRAFGELCVRGPWVLSQYYANPKASRAGFDDAGWFRTGDVATIDADGFVQIVDRTKDLIKSGGEWISSIEIESVALGHPDIAEAGVIGISDSRWGERPLLILTAKPGRSASSTDILAYLKTRLPKMSLPDRIEFLDQLPRNATGKILKTELRETFKHYKSSNV